MLRVMLETAEAAETLEQDEMDDEELNLILARSDAELQVFKAMDEDRAKDMTYGNKPGSKKLNRLMQEDELPEIYMSDGNPISDEPVEITGRGARERTRVKYDDGLTEEQWLNAVDDDEDSPEAAAARKEARKSRREQNRLKRLGEIPGSIENSPVGSRESTEEPEPIPKKARGRKNAKGKRQAEEAEDEPPAKRNKRGGPGRPKASASNGDSLTSKHRQVLQTSLRTLFDTLWNLTSDSDSGSTSGSSGEDEGKRLIINPFKEVVKKRDFPDYHQIIKEPISMKEINQKIKKEQYSSLGDFKRDIQLMCFNCKQYNEDGSLLYIDALTIEKACDAKIRNELNEHPELADLDDMSRNGGSSAPTTSAGTPIPNAAPATKLKLTFNNSSYANGGSSGAQSDDDD
jgi:ATP-dependent helicase STH1/SNF2